MEYWQRIVLPVCSMVTGREIEETFQILDLDGFAITKVEKTVFTYAKRMI